MCWKFNSMDTSFLHLNRLWVGNKYGDGRGCPNVYHMLLYQRLWLWLLIRLHSASFLLFRKVSSHKVNPQLLLLAVYFSSNLTFLNSDKIEDTCTHTTIKENCGPLNNLLLYQKRQEGCRWHAHEPRSYDGESIDSPIRSLLFYGPKNY